MAPRALIFMAGLWLRNGAEAFSGKAGGKGEMGMSADQRSMSAEHGGEWRRFREEILNPLYERVAGGDEKNAKALADILKITQEGERKAFLFGGGQEADTALDVAFAEE